VLVVLGLVAGRSASAADRIWANTSTSWNSGSSWTGGVAPVPGDRAIFNSASVTDPFLTSNVSIANLYFSTTTSSNYDISSTNNTVGLTLTSTSLVAGERAIDALNTGSINSLLLPVVLAGAAGSTQAFHQARGGILSFGGPISSTNSITLRLDASGTGTATFSFNGANTYSGTTSINNANILLNLNNATALGTSTLATTGAGVTIGNASGAAITLTNNNNINLSGGSLTFNGPRDLSFGNNVVTMSGSGRTITTIEGTLTIGSVTEDGTARSFTKAGTSKLVITGNSTYTGSTTIQANGGTLEIANNGTTTAGKLATTSGVLVNAGGTLLLSGSSSVTDRINNNAGITLAGSGSTTGGQFNTGGLSEGTRPSSASSTDGVAGLGALTLQNTSSTSRAVIDFTSGTGSSAVFGSLVDAAGAFVNVLNWTGLLATDNGATTNDRLLFAADPGLTTAQLANWTFFNDSGVAYANGAMIIPYGNMFEMVPVPEPGTYAAGMLALLAVSWTQRKRLASLLDSRARR
jgi:autotransporter-associated beta strand protein